MNKVILIGNLCKDFELRYAAGSGTAVARNTLAVKREFKKDESDFINILAFGKTAETLTQYLVKGNKVALTGRIQTGSYDAQDGTKRYTTEVVVDSFEFVESKKNNTGSHEKEHETMKDTFAGAEEGFGDISPIDDGDLPF